MGKKVWISVAVAASAAGGLWYFQGSSGNATNARRDAAPVPVTTITAERRDMRVELSAIGTVQANRTVAVKPQVDGQLLSLHFAEGQNVREGEVLARIDPRPYQIALDQAQAKRAQDKAQLANAREDLARYAALADKQFASRQTLEGVRARVAALEAAVKADDAAVDQAKLQLDRTAIRAPMDGRAGLSQVDPGNILHGGGFEGMRGGGSSGGGGPGGGSDTIVVLTQTQPLAVSFTLPQDQLAQLLPAQAKGQLELKVSTREGQEPLDSGWLEAIDSQVDPATGSIRLKGKLPNANNQLWPGQFVTARLLVGVKSQTIALPTSAVLRGPQGQFAYVAKEDGTVEPRKIATGFGDESQVEIVQGIDPGENVVISGQARLRPGARIAARIAKAD